MTKERALRFLATHSPMPDDEQPTDELINEYDDGRRFSLAHPDAACIRPFMFSFGRWGGRGVYQLVSTLSRP